MDLGIPSAAEPIAIPRGFRTPMIPGSEYTEGKEEGEQQLVRITRTTHYLKSIKRLSSFQATVSSISNKTQRLKNEK